MKIKIFLLIVLSLLSSWRFFRPGYASMQDDIQVFRLQQFDQCLRDGQVPCRYIADGGLGYGYPLYNFYSPLPYAISESFHLLGFSYIDSIKITFIIPAFLRTFGMYLLATAFFGSFGGFLAAALYALAPYQAVNSLVRGAIGETWALALLPLVFWSLYQHKVKLSVLFLSCLLLSHNLTLIYAIPLLVVFSILTKKFKYLFRTLLWSGALCAFFLIPAFFEKNFTTVNTMTQGYFNFIIHFATLKELFISNFWGYSASMWGPIDGLSFNIGLFQWLIPILVFVLYTFKRKLKHRLIVTSFFLIGLFAIFLTHNKSTFIWNSLPFMAYFQFPWRFLGLSIFCFSFIGGGLVKLVKPNLKLPLIIGLITIIVFINYPNFREDIWYGALTDNQKLNGSELIRQSGAGLKDYWPKYSQNFPDSYAPSSPIVLEGDVDFVKYYKNSHFSEAYLSVSSPTAIFNLPIVYFPEWELVVDGIKSDYTIEPDLGLIQIKLNQGEHHLQLSFVETPLRTFSNLFSLFALASFIILIIREKRS
ncbi:TPA: hypothetical protein DD455_02805 [Candidatus Shapirobacteria bacterium]|nr:hypothetical protein [Candidatus Shapirobacteria bacterium]